MDIMSIQRNEQALKSETITPTDSAAVSQTSSTSSFHTPVRRSSNVSVSLKTALFALKESLSETSLEPEEGEPAQRRESTNVPSRTSPVEGEHVNGWRTLCRQKDTTMNPSSADDKAPQRVTPISISRVVQDASNANLPSKLTSTDDCKLADSKTTKYADICSNDSDHIVTDAEGNSDEREAGQFNPAMPVCPEQAKAPACLFMGHQLTHEYYVGLVLFKIHAYDVAH